MLDDDGAVRIRRTYLIVLGVIVVMSMAGLIIMALAGQPVGSDLLVGSIGSVAIGALAALARE